MKHIQCPHCGGEISTTRKPKRKSAGGTVNPFNHPFPHAKLVHHTNVPRLMSRTRWSIATRADYLRVMPTGFVPSWERATA
jgi:Cu/Zn superoxide dismutase